MSKRQLSRKLIGARDLLKEAYNNGATIRELAYLFEASPGTIRTRLMESGVVLRSRGRSKRSK